jgi:septal ring factor EnvC (AmiA/AmiB activator)
VIDRRIRVRIAHVAHAIAVAIRAIARDVRARIDDVGDAVAVLVVADERVGRLWREVDSATADQHEHETAFHLHDLRVRRSLMRTIHTLVAVLAFSAGACKNETNKRADQVENARKDVDRQQNDVVHARRDLNQQQRELDKAHTDLAAAQTEYSNALKDPLAKNDQKLDDLAARPEATARADADRLRARRNELSARLDTAADTTADRWDAYKKDVDDSFTKLEDDINDAVKNDRDKNTALPRNDLRKY